MILPHAQEVHACASHRLTAGEMYPALGMLLMLVCATAAKAKDGGNEEQMTQVSISSAFDSPQVLQECLSYLRQTAQDQVADNNRPAHQIRQCRATKSSASVHESKAEGGMLFGAELLSGVHSGRQELCGISQGEPHVRHAQPQAWSQVQRQPQLLMSVAAMRRLGCALQVWKQPGWPLPDSQDGVFVQLDSLKDKRLYYLPFNGGLLRSVAQSVFSGVQLKLLTTSRCLAASQTFVCMLCGSNHDNILCQAAGTRDQ